MKLSVIIPAYNAAETLKSCLEAIYDSSFKDFEVIVVDDFSSDDSTKIASFFPGKLIRLNKHSGSGTARNRGAQEARGDIIVFIDADVVIKKDSFDIILDSFNKDKEITAVIGYFSCQHPHQNFFSQYKNLYMHFIFANLAEYVDFLFTSICAIKKELYREFSSKQLKADDTELGQRYKLAGQKIMLNKNLSVVHFKKYSFRSLLKNDFIIPYDWMRLFLRYQGYKDIFKKKRFAHARLNQILGVVISPVILIFVIGAITGNLNPIIALSLVGLFFILNLRFLLFLNKERGFLFTLRSLILTYLDSLVMGMGIFWGLVSY